MSDSNLGPRKAGKLVTVSISVGIVLLAAVGSIGFLHTPTGRKLPIGRKLLSWMGVKCPIDTTHLTAREVEESRQRGVTSLRGKKLAPNQPTLAGLDINRTTEEEAQTWAALRGISCASEIKGMRFLKCKDVSPFALGEQAGKTPIQTLTLAFSPENRLVAVDVFRRKLNSREAAQVMTDLSAKLSEKLGPPTESLGELSDQELSGKTLKVSFVHYRFKNYLALLTATNIPWSGGVAVHEQYSSITSGRGSRDQSDSR
jgi:hypothetical protein